MEGGSLVFLALLVFLLFVLAYLSVEASCHVIIFGCVCISTHEYRVQISTHHLKKISQIVTDDVILITIVIKPIKTTSHIVTDDVTLILYMLSLCSAPYVLIYASLLKLKSIAVSHACGSVFCF